MHFLWLMRGKTFFWPGQGISLQDWMSSLSPTQSAPSNFGGGLVHVLERFFFPPPQDTEHSVNALHADQFASTEKQITSKGVRHDDNCYNYYVGCKLAKECSDWLPTTASMVKRFRAHKGYTRKIRTSPLDPICDVDLNRPLHQESFQITSILLGSMVGWINRCDKTGVLDPL